MRGMDITFISHVILEHIYEKRRQFWEDRVHLKVKSARRS